MKSTSLFSVFVFIIIIGIGLLSARPVYSVTNIAETAIITGNAFVIAPFISVEIRIADPWDKAVVLHLGQFKPPKGQGLFFIVPIIDNISYWIDTRAITTTFNVEKTLAKDYQGLKQNPTILIVPSSVFDTIQLGSMAGLTALTIGIGQDKANKEITLD